MRLCFYVIRSFLPSLPGGRRDADPGIKSPPAGTLPVPVPVADPDVEAEARAASTRERDPSY